MTTEAQTIETAPAARPNAGSRRTAVVAIAVVALAAGGAALAASKFHGSSSSAAGGPGGGFAPPSQAQGGQGFGPSGGFRDRGPGGLGGLSAAADYLGISTSTLFSDMQSGKTLAQIAQATSGKSVQGLIDAMVAAQKTELESAVSSGRLSQAQADQLGSQIESRITDMVNGSFGRPDGRGFGPPGRSAPGGVTL